MSNKHMTNPHEGWKGAPYYCLYCKSGIYMPEHGDDPRWLICQSCGDGYNKKEYEDKISKQKRQPDVRSSSDE